MAINYYVLKYCETESAWKSGVQVDTVDPEWIPDGCEEHILNEDSFCVDWKEEL